MSISIANAVPGLSCQAEKPLPQSENTRKMPVTRRIAAVTPRNSDVTFDVKNVSLLFHATHFETLDETCNRQEESTMKRKCNKNSRRVPAE
ncbi:hypothetical protein [Janthinobacterium sp.]|uniref:hypothetical protein n=1 Tax=Janthinobacterium sp. TaxID=1871054 RepID=UPI002DBD3675|nr:hypothetical protein [Janthinobacterium sp.]HEU4815788.1 hypothetical protein [Janthinobacterium sp.]